MKLTFLSKDQNLKREIETLISSWEDHSDCIKIHTSGSTGKPKLISIKKTYMRASALATCRYLGIHEGDTALLCLSPKTIGGAMMIIRSIVMNLELIVSDISSSPLDHLEKPIDFAALVPLQIHGILDKTPHKINYLKNIIIGGGVLAERLQHELLKTNIKVFQTFGMTETVSHFALKEISPNTTDHYHCLPGATIDTNDNKLVVNYPAVGVKQLETNDLIEKISTTEFKWIGRADFVINSGGIKIHPAEIEDKLDHLIHVPFFSVGIKDNRLGSKHVICVESNKDLQLTKQQLVEILDSKIIPREIHYYDTFIRTKSEKINRPETIKTKARAIKKIL